MIIHLIKVSIFVSHIYLYINNKNLSYALKFLVYFQVLEKQIELKKVEI